jgi:hypothetical protein
MVTVAQAINSQRYGFIQASPRGFFLVVSQVTVNKNGRFIERSIYQEALEENQKRVEENPEYYRLRQQITEHRFGTLKRQWGFTHTLMRGKQNVLSEVNLIMICYNLKRLVSILDPKVLKDRLKMLVAIFFALFEEISAPRADFLLFRIPHPHSDIT